MEISVSDLQHIDLTGPLEECFEDLYYSQGMMGILSMYFRAID